MSEVKFTRQNVLSLIKSEMAVKWSYAVLSEGYIPMPKMFVRTLSRIVGDIRDLQVVLAIVDFKRPNLTRQPSLKFLAFIAGLPEEVFETRLRQMNEKGWVLIGGNKDQMNVNLDPLLKLVEDEAKKQDAEIASLRDVETPESEDMPF